MTTDENLAAAIRQIQHTAIKTTEPQIREMKVRDGRGGEIALPIIFTPDAGGNTRWHVPLEQMRAGVQLATELRLAGATGPDTITGMATLTTRDHLIAHAERFRRPESALWGNADEMSVTAVYDYHGGPSTPGWRQHRARLALKESAAWAAWGGVHGLELSQEEFVALLDRRDTELAVGDVRGQKTPEPAWLLGFVGNLETYHHKTAKLGRDPQTGKRTIVYSDDKGLSGNVAPPKSFLVKIPIFADSWEEPFEVRLNIRIDDGEPVFILNIHDAREAMDKAFCQICEQISNETGIPLFLGSPET